MKDNWDDVSDDEPEVAAVRGTYACTQYAVVNIVAEREE